MKYTAKSLSDGTMNVMQDGEVVANVKNFGAACDFVKARLGNNAWLTDEDGDINWDLREYVPQVES